MTFAHAGGSAFAMEVYSQTTFDDRCAAGIVHSHDRVVDHILSQRDGGYLAYMNDNCNLMLKVRSIIISIRKIFAGGCWIHVQQNSCIAILLVAGM